MKTERRKLNITIDRVEVEPHMNRFDMPHRTIEIEGRYEDFDMVDLTTIEITAEVRVPETINSFIEFHGIESKSKLLEWLNKNYEK